MTDQMVWNTSSYSNQEPNFGEETHILNFRKSSYSGVNNSCVEVADLPCGAAVRDSKHPTHGHLPFPAPEWTAFLTTTHHTHS